MITVTNEIDGSKFIVISEKSIAAFQQLIQRAANLWPDATAEIKEFADKITIGHVQQNYNDDTKKEKAHYAHKCSCGWITVIDLVTGAVPEEKIKCLNPNRLYVWNDEEGKEQSKTAPCNAVEKFNSINLDTTTT